MGMAVVWDSIALHSGDPLRHCLAVTPGHSGPSNSCKHCTRRVHFARTQQAHGPHRAIHIHHASPCCAHLAYTVPPHAPQNHARTAVSPRTCSSHRASTWRTRQTPRPRCSPPTQSQSKRAISGTFKSSQWPRCSPTAGRCWVSKPSGCRSPTPDSPSSRTSSVSLLSSRPLTSTLFRTFLFANAQFLVVHVGESWRTRR
jgi:hypothetical protein